MTHTAERLDLAPSEAAPAEPLVGVPVSPGSATGRARLVVDGDNVEIEPGDILVVGVLEEALRPLLWLAGGLVAEADGAFSDAAVLARETRVPVVADVQGATSLIVDGALIRIDGTNGLVFLDQ